MRKQFSGPIRDEGRQLKLTYEWMMRNKIASVSRSYKCFTVKGRKEKGAEWQVDGLKGFIICLFFDKMRKVEHEYSK